MADKLVNPYRYVTSQGASYDTPGQSYTIEYDAMMCGWLKSAGGSAAFIALDGVQIIGVANQQMYLSVPVKKGQVLTTRSGDGFSYDLRFFPLVGGVTKATPRASLHRCAA